MKENIILIGFMGAGKTRLGLELAGHQLIDTDRMIEEKAGMTIAALFEAQGEEVFRSLETQILCQLLEECEGKVISTGGGLPLKEENRRLLRELGTVFYLQVKPETVLKRLEGDITRPLLLGSDRKEKVEALLRERDGAYRQAAHEILQVDEKTPEKLADDIVRRMKEREGRP